MREVPGSGPSNANIAIVGEAPGVDGRRDPDRGYFRGKGGAGERSFGAAGRRRSFWAAQPHHCQRGAGAGRSGLSPKKARERSFTLPCR